MCDTFWGDYIQLLTATYPHEKSQFDIENVFDSSNSVFKLRIYGQRAIAIQKKLIHLVQIRTSAGRGAVINGNHSHCVAEHMTHMGKNARRKSKHTNTHTFH